MRDQERRIVSSALSLVASANENQPPLRRVLPTTAKRIVKRSLKLTQSLPFSLREHAALRDVSDFISLAQKDKSSFRRARNTDLLPIAHPRSTKAHTLSLDSLYTYRSRWYASDPDILSDEARTLVASAYASLPGSVEHTYFSSRLQALPEGTVPLDVLLASIFGGGNSRAARSARARAQRRDRKGRFAWMGGGLSFFVRMPNGGVRRLSGRLIAQGVGPDDDTFDIETEDGTLYRGEARAGEAVKAFVPATGAEGGFSPVTTDDDPDAYSMEYDNLRRIEAPNGFYKDEDYDGPGERFTDDTYEVIKIDPNDDDQFDMVPEYLLRRDEQGRELLDYNKPVYIARRKDSDATDNGYQSWADVQDWIKADEVNLDEKEGRSPDALARLTEEQYDDLVENVGEGDPYEYAREKFGVERQEDREDDEAEADLDEASEEERFDFVNVPDDAYEIDLYEDFVPGENPDAESDEYTEDPGELASVFDEDELRNALYEAISPSDAGPATGRGNLEFGDGEVDSVPAEALYQALRSSMGEEEAEYDLADMYDNMAGGSDNRNALDQFYGRGEPEGEAEGEEPQAEIPDGEPEEIEEIVDPGEAPAPRKKRKGAAEKAAPRQRVEVDETEPEAEPERAPEAEAPEPTPEPTPEPAAKPRAKRRKRREGRKANLNRRRKEIANKLNAISESLWDMEPNPDWADWEKEKWEATRERMSGFIDTAADKIREGAEDVNKPDERLIAEANSDIDRGIAFVQRNLKDGDDTVRELNEAYDEFVEFADDLEDLDWKPEAPADEPEAPAAPDAEERPTPEPKQEPEPQNVDSAEDVSGAPRVARRASDVYTDGGDDYPNVVPILDGGEARVVAGREVPSTTLVPGKQISKDDLPDTIYHVSTNASAVRDSGVLRFSKGGDRAGLGGSHSEIVSFSADPEVAKGLVNDMKMYSELMRTDDLDTVLERLRSEFDSRGMSGFEEIEKIAELGRDKEFGSVFDSMVSQYFGMRSRQTGERNPVILGGAWKKDSPWWDVDPDNIDMFEVPKDNIPDEALIVDFDRGKSFGLEEVRVYADVPLESREEAVPEDKDQDKDRAEVPEVPDLPALLDGLSDDEKAEYERTGDYKPYLPKNEDFDVPEGFYSPDPDPFENVDENPDVDPINLAENNDTETLTEALTNAVSPDAQVPGNGIVEREDSDGEMEGVSVPAEALRDALQLQGEDTNEILGRVFSQGQQEEETQEEDPAAEIPGDGGGEEPPAGPGDVSPEEPEESREPETTPERPSPLEPREEDVASQEGSGFYTRSSEGGLDTSLEYREDYVDYLFDTDVEDLSLDELSDLINIIDQMSPREQKRQRRVRREAQDELQRRANEGRTGPQSKFVGGKFINDPSRARIDVEGQAPEGRESLNERIGELNRTLDEIKKEDPESAQLPTIRREIRDLLRQLDEMDAEISRREGTEPRTNNEGDVIRDPEPEEKRPGTITENNEVVNEEGEVFPDTDNNDGKEPSDPESSETPDELPNQSEQDSLDEEFLFNDEEFPPTEQQKDIVRAFLTGDNIVVRALAGTGKTSTLKLMARALKKMAPNKKILYVAFNKSVQQDAEKSMPDNVEARTDSSLAYRWARKALINKLSYNRGKRKNLIRRPKDIAEEFNIQPRRLDGDDKRATEVASIINKAIDNYAISDDDELGWKHFPLNEESFSQDLVDKANEIWADINSDNGRVEITQNHLTKMWALSRPDLRKDLGVDIIFFDEAQDINPVLAKVIADQEIQKVYVGDENQAIYGFRGAVDQLKRVFVKFNLPLTKSWRFGPQIAGVANRFLTLLNAEHRVEGGGPDGDIIRDGMDDADAVVVRTNAGAISEILRELNNGRRVGVSKQYKAELASLVETAEWLKGGGNFRNRPNRVHPDLAGFKNWDEVREAAEDRELNQKISMLYRMVEDNGIEELKSVVDRAIGVDAKRGKDDNVDVVITTAHKAKGLEWDRVRIGNDFWGPKVDRETGEVILPSEEELRIAYVAVTRAQKALDPGALSWVFDHTKDSDESHTRDALQRTASNVDPQPTLARNREEMDRRADALRPFAEYGSQFNRGIKENLDRYDRFIDQPGREAEALNWLEEAEKDLRIAEERRRARQEVVNPEDGKTYEVDVVRETTDEDEKNIVVRDEDGNEGTITSVPNNADAVPVADAVADGIEDGELLGKDLGEEIKEQQEFDQKLEPAPAAGESTAKKRRRITRNEKKKAANGRDNATPKIPILDRLVGMKRIPKRDLKGGDFRDLGAARSMLKKFASGWYSRGNIMPRPVHRIVSRDARDTEDNNYRDKNGNIVREGDIVVHGRVGELVNPEYEAVNLIKGRVVRRDDYIRDGVVYKGGLYVEVIESDDPEWIGRDDFFYVAKQGYIIEQPDLRDQVIEEDRRRQKSIEEIYEQSLWDLSDQGVYSAYFSAVESGNIELEKIAANELTVRNRLVPRDFAQYLALLENDAMDFIPDWIGDGDGVHGQMAKRLVELERRRRADGGDVGKGAEKEDSVQPKRDDFEDILAMDRQETGTAEGQGVPQGDAPEGPRNPEDLVAPEFAENEEEYRRELGSIAEEIRGRELSEEQKNNQQFWDQIDAAGQIDRFNQEERGTERNNFNLEEAVKILRDGLGWEDLADRVENIRQKYIGEREDAREQERLAKEREDIQNRDIFFARRDTDSEDPLAFDDDYVNYLIDSGVTNLRMRELADLAQLVNQMDDDRVARNFPGFRTKKQFIEEIDRQLVKALEEPDLRYELYQGEKFVDAINAGKKPVADKRPILEIFEKQRLNPKNGGRPNFLDKRGKELSVGDLIRHVSAKKAREKGRGEITSLGFNKDGKAVVKVKFEDGSKSTFLASKVIKSNDIEQNQNKDDGIKFSTSISDYGDLLVGDNANLLYRDQLLDAGNLKEVLINRGNLSDLDAEAVAAIQNRLTPLMSNSLLSDEDVTRLAELSYELDRVHLANNPLPESLGPVGEELLSLDIERIIRDNGIDTLRSGSTIDIVNPADGTDTGWMAQGLSKGQIGVTFFMIHKDTGQKFVVKKERNEDKAAQEVMGAAVARGLGIHGATYVQLHNTQKNISIQTYAGASENLTQEAKPQNRWGLNLEQVQVLSAIKFTLLDSIIHNRDRHGGNFLVSEVEAGREKYVAPFPIDMAKPFDDFDFDNDSWENTYNDVSDDNADKFDKLGEESMFKLANLSVQQMVQYLRRIGADVDNDYLREMAEVLIARGLSVEQSSMRRIFGIR